MALFMGGACTPRISICFSIAYVHGSRQRPTALGHARVFGGEGDDRQIRFHEEQAQWIPTQTNCGTIPNRDRNPNSFPDNKGKILVFGACNMRTQKKLNVSPIVKINISQQNTKS